MPVVEARGLGVRHRGEWVFRDVDVAVGPGELRALTGPAGSGRTSLLLALAGRLRITTGTLRRSGPAALGLIPGVHEPEPALTVAEHMRERALLLGHPRRNARFGRVRKAMPSGHAPRSTLLGDASEATLLARLPEGDAPAPQDGGRAPKDGGRAAQDGGRAAQDGGRAPEDALLGLDPAARVARLTPYRRQLLGLALARLSGPHLIVADDVDLGLDAAERAAMWDVLAFVAAEGPAVIVSCREAPHGITRTDVIA